MDEIFHKTTSIFDVVKVANEMPRRFGKNGELLINYEDTEEYIAAQRRRSSVTAPELGEPKQNISTVERDGNEKVWGGIGEPGFAT